MKKRIFSTIMTIMMIFSICIGSITPIAAAPAAAKTITAYFDITNKMQNDIVSIKISPTGEEAWGKELITTPIKKGTTVSIPLTFSSNKVVCDLLVQAPGGADDPGWGTTFERLDFTGITAASGGIIILIADTWASSIVFNKAGAVGAGLPVGSDTITAVFNVKNETNKELISLQLSLPGKEEWGQNLLKAPLSVGATASFKFTFSTKAAQWDIMANSADESNVIKIEKIDFTGITAASGGNIFLKTDPIGVVYVFSKTVINPGIAASSNTRTVNFNVKNESQGAYTSLQISQAGKEAWSPNLLTEPLAAGATVIIPITFSDEISEWDIKGINVDGDDLDAKEVDFSGLTPASGGNIALRYSTSFGRTAVVSNNRVKTPYPKQSGNSIMFFDTDSDGVISADEAKEQLQAAAPNMTTGFTASLSDKITTVGKKAFNNMPITKLTLPSSVKSIEDEAFANNNMLKSVTFAEGLTTTGYGSFMKTGLQSVSLPKSLRTIGKGCFGSCEMLTNITIQEGLTTIGSGAFASTPISGIKLPESLAALGEGAFMNCTKLKSISIPVGMKKLEARTFSGCTGLTDVVIPGVTSIEEQAFLECTALTKLQLPATLSNVGYSIVDFCSNLAAISVDTANPNFTAQDGILYSKDLKAIYDYPNARADKTLVLPSTVTVIKSGAFGNTVIENVTLPAGLKTIEELAFNHCAALKGITIPDGLEKIGDQAFFACTSLSGDLVLPKSMKEYGRDIFRVTNLKNITINSNINLNYGMFMGSGNIETVKINGEFPKIGEGVFLGCEKLKSINLPKTLKSIESAAFDSCTSLPSITLPEGLVNLGKKEVAAGSDTESNGGVFNNCKSLKTITIPNSVIYIETASFMGCTSLKTAKLPVNAKYNKIEKRTFSLSGIEEIFIPKNVITIGEKAFEAASLKKLTIEPNGVKYIEDIAFSATKLEEVVLPVGVLTMGWSSFSDINPLKTVTLSSTIELIQPFTFYKIPSCTRINLISSKKIEIGPFNFEDKAFVTKGAIHVPKNYTAGYKAPNGKYYINSRPMIADLPVLPKGKAGY